MLQKIKCWLGFHSLKELRNNTWDVDRVNRAINWLKDNFEVK